MGWFSNIWDNLGSWFTGFDNFMQQYAGGSSFGATYNTPVDFYSGTSSLAGSYQPSYTPSAPVITAAPAQDYSYTSPVADYVPPADYAPYTPPADVYQPPAYTPPADVYQPPAYTPPADVYQPPAYEPPAYTPPADVYQPPAYEPPPYVPSGVQFTDANWVNPGGTDWFTAPTGNAWEPTGTPTAGPMPQSFTDAGWAQPSNAGWPSQQPQQFNDPLSMRNAVSYQTTDLNTGQITGGGQLDPVQPPTSAPFTGAAAVPVGWDNPMSGAGGAYDAYGYNPGAQGYDASGLGNYLTDFDATMAGAPATANWPDAPAPAADLSSLGDPINASSRTQVANNNNPGGTLKDSGGPKVDVKANPGGGLGSLLTALLGGGQGGQTNQPGVRPSGGINTGGVPALLGGVVSEQARQRQQQTLNEAQQTLGLQRTAVDQVATNAQQVADANQARYDTQGGIFRDADSLRRSMYDPEAAAEDARRGYLNAANKRRRQMARGAAGGGRGYAEMEARRYDVESPLGAETAARNAYLGAGTAGLKNAATTYGMVPGLTPTNFGGVASAYSGLGANQLGIMNAQGQLGLQQAANYGGIASGALDIGRGLATWFGNQGSEPLRRFNEESRP